MRPGDRVRMTEAHKQNLRGNCLQSNHTSEEDCMYCSTRHVEEFGECIGVVIGLTNFNNVPVGHPDYYDYKVGPEFDVRWQPSNLRYAYPESALEVVEQSKEIS